MAATYKNFRKKPVVIQASRWFKNGDHPEDHSVPMRDAETGETFLTEGLVVRRFRHPDITGDKICITCRKTMHEHGWIDTLEGDHIVCPGDWIIRDVEGKFYTCNPSIFEATYEYVAEESD